MGGVVVAVAVNVVAQAVMTVYVAARNFFAKIVSIRAFARDDRSERACAVRSRSDQLVFSETAVFHKHKRSTGLFLRMHERP